MDENAPDPQVTVIAPNRGGLAQALAECWQSRELMMFLSWRDISVRYKQTLLGVAWAVLQPLMTMVVFALVFNRMAGITFGSESYAVAVFAGLLPWQLFQGALTQSSQSIVSEARLITKVYFPRLLVPAATVGAALVDFCLSFLVLVGLMAWYGVALKAPILLIPVFVVMAVLAALSLGLWLTALNAKYRDVRHAVPFLVRIWMFLSPVAYPAARLASSLPEDWRWVLCLNPMVGVIEGFRWAILGSAAPDPAHLLASGLVIGVLLFTGLLYFRHMERTFADVV